MEQDVIKEAPTVEEALDAALEQLGVQQDAVDFEVLVEPTKSFFGRTGRPARVRVRLKPEFVAELEASEREDEDPDDGLPPVLLASEVVAEVTEEELDRIADEAVSSIQRIVKCFDIKADVEEYEGDDGELILDITGEDLGVLIGRHGRTLDALQTIVGAVTHRRIGRRYPVLVDVEGYRFRRKAKLEEIARSAADRASRQNRAVRLRPMTSYERKVVHVTLRDDRRVTTGSEGEEPFRTVVITPR